MNESDLNRLLQQALAPKEFPSDQLNQTIRNRVQEEQTMKRFSKKRPLAAALVAAKNGACCILQRKVQILQRNLLKWL